jgi:hypothetical protein
MIRSPPAYSRKKKFFAIGLIWIFMYQHWQIGYHSTCLYLKYYQYYSEKLKKNPTCSKSFCILKLKPQLILQGAEESGINAA